MADGKSIAQKLRENIAALKQQGAPKERIDEELSYWQGKLNEQSAADPERQRTFGESAGAAAGAALNSATLGVSGLVDDALSSGSFAGNREFRRQETESLPTGVRLAAEIGGAVASPVGSIGTAARALKAAKTLQEARGAAKLLKVGGTLVPQAARGTGWANRGNRIARTVGDAAAQSGISGTVNSFDDVSAEGVGNAVTQGAKTAVAGGIGAGVLGTAAGMGARAVERLKNVKRLDKLAFSTADDMAKMDKANYGAAADEASSTGPIREVLQYDPIAAPIAKEVRWDANYQGKPMTDAEALMASYKRLSAQQRQVQSSIDASNAGIVGFNPKLSEGTIGNIVRAKENLLGAAERPSTVVVPGRARSTPAPRTAGGGYGGQVNPSVREGIDAPRTRLAQAVTVAQQKAKEALSRHGEETVVSPSLAGAPAPGRFIERPSQTLPIDAGIPSLRKAINAHRVKTGELRELERGADIGLSVGRNKSIPGGKIRTQSREAYLRDVPDMTDPEAELGLAGIMARFPEQVSLTSSPLGAFGLVTSAVRAPLTMARTMPLIRALEEKLGRGKMGQPTADMTRGTLARLFGARQ